MSVDRQPNERLVDLMREANLSAKALARAIRENALKSGEDINCDHTAVARWRAGGQPRPRTAQLLCEVLGRRLGRLLTPDDVGLFSPLSLGVEIGISYPEDPQETVVALADLWRADAEDVSVIVNAPTSDAAWSEASLAWLVRPGRDDVGVRDNVRMVGFADVEAIRATTATFDHLDNRFGGRHARQALVQFLRTDLAPALRGSSTGAAGRELFRAGAEATLLTAWMSYDAGVHGLAQRYFIQALRLADAADDVLLAGSILDAMSHQATFLGRFREAATLARAAQTGAGRQASPGLRAHFLAMEARAHAGAGDRAATERVLAQAVQLFDARREESEPEWMRYFDEGELAAEFAHCYRDLGDAARAVEYARQALARAGTSQRSDYFVGMVLAGGELTGGNVDQAIDTMAGVVGRGTSVKSDRAVEYLRQFRRQLPGDVYKVVESVHPGIQGSPMWRATTPRKASSFVGHRRAA